MSNLGCHRTQQGTAQPRVTPGADDDLVAVQAGSKADDGFSAFADRDMRLRIETHFLESVLGVVERLESFLAMEFLQLLGFDEAADVVGEHRLHIQQVQGRRGFEITDMVNDPGDRLQ